jgi:hypothetical protein
VLDPSLFPQIEDTILGYCGNKTLIRVRGGMRKTLTLVRCSINGSKKSNGVSQRGAYWSRSSTSTRFKRRMVE